MSGFEVVGAVADAGQFTEQFIAVGKLLRSVYQQMRDGPADILQRFQELETFREIVDQIRSIEPLQTKTAEDIFARCDTYARQLTTILQSISSDAKDPLNQRTWKAIVGVAREEDISKLLSGLEREKASLQLHINAATISISHAAGPQLASIEDKIDRIRSLAPASCSATDRQANCIRDLLEKDQAVVRSGLKTTKGQIVSGTCDWILEDPLYQSWLDSTTKFFWISGGPGMGKTMLSIYLSEHLERRRPNHGDAVIYFFCDSRDQQRNTAVSVVRGLMYQLIRHKADLVDCLLDSYDIYKERLFNGDMFEKLWDIFLAMLTGLRPSKAVCILDGLDECQPDSLRQLLTKLPLLAAAKPEQQQTAGSFKRIFLSREHPTSITSALDTAIRIQLDRGPGSATSEGLERYISLAVDDFGQPTNKDYPEELSLKVKKVLPERSAGTYLWVGFTIRALQDKEPSEVEEFLQRLPSGLDDMYGRLISQFRPGHLEQIRELLDWSLFGVFDGGADFELLVDALGIRANESLTAVQILRDRIAYCRGFVVTLGDTAFLYHQSVEDYFLGVRTSRAASGLLSDLVPFDKSQGHARLASRCLDYLQVQLEQHTYGEFRELGWYSLGFKGSRPFLRYALCKWHCHMREAGPAMLAVADSHKDFFEKNSDVRANCYTWTPISFEDFDYQTAWEREKNWKSVEAPAKAPAVSSPSGSSPLRVPRSG